MLKKQLKHFFKLIHFIISRYRIDNCTLHATSLTIDTLLSLVPLLATGIAVFAISPKLQQLVIDAEHKLLAQFVVDTGYQIELYLEKLSRKAATVSLIGAIFLLITSLKLLRSLQQAFHIILRVHTRRKTLFELLLSAILWLLAPILVGLGLAASSFIMSLSIVKGKLLLLKWLKPLLTLIPILLTTIAFSFLYIITPRFIVPATSAILGAFIAASLFEAAKWLFGLYLLHFPNYQLVYGALAAFPLFIIWLYVSWQIVLFGAIITHSLVYKQRERSELKLDGFVHAICWLGYLRQAKRPLTLTDLITNDDVSYQVEPEEMLEQLTELGLIKSTVKGQYNLSHQLTGYSLLELYTILPWKPSGVKLLQQLQFSYKDKLLELLAKFEQCQEQHLNMPLEWIYHLEAEK